jgi:hypothetical protein
VLSVVLLYKCGDTKSREDIRISMDRVRYNNISFDVIGVEVTPADQEVPMEVPSGTYPYTADEGEVIYTRHMTECAAIATYDHSNRERMLCHAGGSNFLPEFFKVLAKKISSTTTVFFAMGTDWKAEGAPGMSIIEEWKRDIRAEVAKLGKSSSGIEWIDFWQVPEAKIHHVVDLATFALRPDGSYGLVRKPEDD